MPQPEPAAGTGMTEWTPEIIVNTSVRRTEMIMGTAMSVDIRRSRLSHSATQRALESAFAVLREDDARFSPYRRDSELSRLDRGELDRAGVSPLMAEVLALGEAVEQASGGAYRCRRPDGHLDTNAVVKGWSASRAANRLTAAGIGSFCFNAGGDVVVRGRPDRDVGRRWHVALRSPRSTQPLAVLALDNQAVATSGRYERGDHLWDGRTGRASVDLTTVSVVAADLTTADLLATAVFALGPAGVQWAADHYDCAVLAETEAGELLEGGHLRGLLAPSEQVNAAPRVSDAA